MTKVYRAARKEGKAPARKAVTPRTPVSADAQERLARIMNDSPTIVKLKGTEWEIRALKPAVQWMIAEEACKVLKNEEKSFGDVLRGLSLNIPVVARCLALAMLNDKERIEREYQDTFDTLMWGGYEIRDWATLLYEMLQLIDVDFFFASTSVIATVRRIMERKTTMAERG